MNIYFIVANILAIPIGKKHVTLYKTQTPVLTDLRCPIFFIPNQTETKTSFWYKLVFFKENREKISMYQAITATFESFRCGIQETEILILKFSFKQLSFNRICCLHTQETGLVKIHIMVSKKCGQRVPLTGYPLLLG